jgi:hypothetical protein
VQAGSKPKFPTAQIAFSLSQIPDFHAIVNAQETSDKGKPGESRGRKAMGLTSRK